MPLPAPPSPALAAQRLRSLKVARAQSYQGQDERPSSQRLAKHGHARLDDHLRAPRVVLDGQVRHRRGSHCRAPRRRTPRVVHRARARMAVAHDQGTRSTAVRLPIRIEPPNQIRGEDLQHERQALKAARALERVFHREALRRAALHDALAVYARAELEEARGADR